MNKFEHMPCMPSTSRVAVSNLCLPQAGAAHARRLACNAKGMGVLTSMGEKLPISGGTRVAHGGYTKLCGFRYFGSVSRMPVSFS